MRITDWPLDDRPREKMLSQGTQSLTNAELLAIILRSGTVGKTALDIAKELLTEYGSLKKLAYSNTSCLLKKKGIGKAKVAVILAAIELGQRFDSEKPIIGDLLNNSKVTERFLATRLKHYSNEVFACLFLDNQFRFLSFEILFYGTINHAAIYPREMVRRGLHHNAAKMIIAHNHPSGNPLPSDADKEVTTLVIQTLSLVEIELVDHIIIGAQENFSFAQANLI